MSILSATAAAKAKSALAYCCVGALSIGANQVYEKRFKPKPKAKTQKVVQRAAVAPAPPICPPVDALPIVGAGEKVDLAAVGALPPGVVAGFFPSAPGGGFVVTAPAPGMGGAPTEVPEPAAVGLFALGLAALALRRRRRPA